MAAPVVAGAAALLLQARPDLNPDQVKALLTGNTNATADRARQLNIRARSSANPGAGANQGLVPNRPSPRRWSRPASTRPARPGPGHVDEGDLDEGDLDEGDLDQGHLDRRRRRPVGQGDLDVRRLRTRRRTASTPNARPGASRPGAAVHVASRHLLEQPPEW